MTHYNMEETYLSVYVWKYGFEKAVKEVGLENVTPRKIRDVSGGIRVEDNMLLRRAWSGSIQTTSTSG